MTEAVAGIQLFQKYRGASMVKNITVSQSYIYIGLT